MDVLQSAINIISAPFMSLAGLLPKQQQQYNAQSQYRPQPQVTRPIQQPVKQLSASQELNAINAEMGLSPVTLTDAEAALYLGKTRQYLQEFRTKQGERAVSQQKYNVGQQEIARKDQQKEQANLQSYQDRENFRINNATQFMQKHNAENTPYLSYMNQMEHQLEQQTRNAPSVPIRFG